MQQDINPLMVTENRCPSCSNNCRILRLVILLILMIAIWAIIIICIIKDKHKYMVIIIVIYIPYLILEYFSYKSLFLEPKSPQEMRALIGKLFTSSPSIQFICYLYLYSEERDKEGNLETHKNYYDSEYESLEILSSRDISGALNFNYEGYSYAYLELGIEVNFADTISYDDYITKKKIFEKEKKEKHAHGSYSVEIKEKRTISDFETSKNYLININNTKNFFLNCGVFIIFVILTLGPIYEIIFYCFVKNLKFTIIKVVSTRYDLSNESKYDPFAPKLIFPKESYNFNKENTSQFDKTKKVVPPTSEALANSMKYKDYIPDYKLYNWNNKNSTGAVINAKNVNQNWKNYENNEDKTIYINQNINNNETANGFIFN